VQCHFHRLYPFIGTKDRIGYDSSHFFNEFIRFSFDNFLYCRIDGTIIHRISDAVTSYGIGRDPFSSLPEIRRDNRKNEVLLIQFYP